MKMSDAWVVKPAAEREVWNFIPQMWFGPLCLLGGWGHRDVEAILVIRFKSNGKAYEINTLFIQPPAVDQ
jgi:hypothetical protein